MFKVSNVQAAVYVCFIGLGDLVPWGDMRGLLWEYGDAGLLVGAIKAIWAVYTQRDGGERRSQWEAGFAKILWFPFFYFKDYCSKSGVEGKDDCFPCTSVGFWVK